jgi:hypothetical protein
VNIGTSQEGENTFIGGGERGKQHRTRNDKKLLVEVAQLNFDLTPNYYSIVLLNSTVYSVRFLIEDNLSDSCV